MVFERVKKGSFCVLGKEGSTFDGEGFVQRLWAQANKDFVQIKEWAVKRDGKPVACWGLMSSFDHSFQPWENNFTNGVYLAGVECYANAEVDGWVKWKVPTAEYIRVLCDEGYPFAEGLRYLQDNGMTLAGAAFDYTDLISGKSYIYFPIRIER